VTLDRDKIEKEDLTKKLRDGHGTTEQAEQWLAQLRKVDPFFDSSDYMLQLETGVEARRIQDELTTQMGERLTKEQLIDLVRRLQRADGTSAEDEAWLNLLMRNLPHSDVSDLIYYSDPELSPEEVVEQALRNSSKQ